MANREIEENLYQNGCSLVIGIDECGVGPLCGNVVACACYFPITIQMDGINDSKKISEKKRMELFKKLTNHPKIIYSIGKVCPAIIDEINILEANFLAMTEALLNLKTKLTHETTIDAILIDGNKIPPQILEYFPNTKIQAIVKGDSQCVCIAAASIIAKVTRDSEMIELSKEYPLYGFDKHKGYPTKKHVEAIKNFGLIDQYHRKSFHIPNYSKS